MEPKTNVLQQPEGPLDSLLEVLRAVFKHRYLALAIFVAIVFIVTLLTIRQPRIYEAVATVEIELREDRVLNDVNDVYQLGEVGYWNADTFFQTQYKIIQSRAVAKMVVEHLHLDRDLAFLDLDPTDSDANIEEKLKSIDAADVVRAGLLVDPIPDSRLVQIRYRSKSPEMAAKIANAYADAYIEQNYERKLSSMRNAMSWLSDQFKDLKEKLETSERALYEFRKENDILSTDMEGKVNITGSRLAELSSEAGKAETTLLQKKALVDSVLKVLPKSGEELENVAAIDVLRSPLIKDLKVTIGQLQNRYFELKAHYKDQHPDVVLIKGQLEHARQNLQNELNSIVAGIKADYDAADQLSKAMHAQLEDAKTQAKDLTLKQVEYNRLLREKDSNQRVFEQVMSRMKEIDLSSMLKVNNIRLLDRAKLSTAPILPRVKLNVMLGILLGILVSLATVVILESMDKSIKGPEDVQRFLAVPVLGVVPGVTIESNSEDAKYPNAVEMFTHNHPKSSIAEYCRTVRTNISFSSPEKPLRRLLITSASPREGKTTIATNLSVTLAVPEKRVVVVDTDMRRPRIHKAFGTHNEYGLSNVIMGKMTLDQAIRPSQVERLDLLTCGPIPPNPAELVGSEIFAKILDDLQARYDWVILDSPPVIAVADSMILSSLVDGVILVVSHSKTPRDMAAQACKQLQDVGGNILGVVLNQMDINQRGYGRYYQYYHYYRRYGYYHLDPQEEAADAAQSATQKAKEEQA